jgi:hypothetical protein
MCATKISMRKVNNTKIFVDEVETQSREKPLRGSQTQELHLCHPKGDKCNFLITFMSLQENTRRCSSNSLLLYTYESLDHVV